MAVTRSSKDTSSGESNGHPTSDEEAWEDVSEPRRSVFRRTSQTCQHTPRPSSPASSLRSSRKRVKARLVATPPRKQPRPKKISRTTTTNHISQEEVVAAVGTGLGSIFSYAWDVVGRAVRWMRKPLSFFLFLWLLAVIIIRINHTIRAAFAPLCHVPGISSSKFCLQPAYDGSGAPKWADYPKLIDVQSATFEQLLDESVGGSSLALEIKKAEMATADLVTLVRVSDLRSRNMLAESLSDFVDDARRAGRGLQKLNSKIGGAVDGIMAVNDYALHAIEEATTKSLTPSASTYFTALVPFLSLWKPTKDVVTQTFTEAMNVLTSSMERLIIEAEVNLSNLDKLEERLGTLHELVSREDSSISSAKSELLSELWSKLGGNKKALRGYDSHLILLKNLSAYRKKALVHVVTALSTLQGMSEDMEDLRERVAAPEIVGGRIPVEVHMKSIKSGLERLKDGRMKAKEREDEAINMLLSAEE